MAWGIQELFTIGLGRRYYKQQCDLLKINKAILSPPDSIHPISSDSIPSHPIPFHPMPSDSIPCHPISSHQQWLNATLTLTEWLTVSLDFYIAGSMAEQGLSSQNITQEVSTRLHSHRLRWTHLHRFILTTATNQYVNYQTTSCEKPLLWTYGTTIAHLKVKETHTLVTVSPMKLFQFDDVTPQRDCPRGRPCYYALPMLYFHISVIDLG